MKKIIYLLVPLLGLMLAGCDNIYSDYDDGVDETVSVNRIYKLENYGYDEAYFCLDRKYGGNEILILLDYDNSVLTRMWRSFVNKTGTETSNTTRTYDFYWVDDNTIKTVDEFENPGEEYLVTYDEEGNKQLDADYSYIIMDITDALSMAREKYNFDFTNNTEVYRKLTSASGINTASEVKRSAFCGTYIGDAKSILILNQDGSLEYYFDEWNDTLSENWELRNNTFEWKSQKFGGTICGKLDLETGDMKLTQGASSILPYWDDENYHRLSSNQTFLSIEDCQKLINDNLLIIQ